MIRLVLSSVLGLAAVLAAADPAAAQASDRLGDFENAYGADYGSMERPIEASTRDASGNRLIVNGRMMLGEGSLQGGLTDYGGGLDHMGLTALGNQLNVVTQGNWNTVIIDSTQINNGDVNVVLNGDQP